MRLARVAPAVVCAALNGHVASLHDALLPTIEFELKLAFDNDANVHGHRTVPDHVRDPGVVVDVADDGAVGDHEGRFVDEVVGIGGQVAVVREWSGEGGHAVEEGEVDTEGGTLPVDGFGNGGLEGGGACGRVVGRDEALDGGEIFVRELRHASSSSPFFLDADDTRSYVIFERMGRWSY